MKDSAKAVFNILGFQYKPLENKLLKMASDQPDFIKWYKKLDYSKKIRALDKFAQDLGL